MLNLLNPVAWLVGIMAVAVVFLLLRSRLSAEARERRRRRRSYRPLEAKGKKRLVKLAVKAERSKGHEPTGD
jgi:hypothetical protein